MSSELGLYQQQVNTQTITISTLCQYVADLLLADFNSSDTGTGTVSVNPGSTSGLTLIGTFTDTKGTNNPGAHPVGTSVQSTTFNFYQDLRSVTESISVRPIMNRGDNDLQEMPDANVNANFILYAILHISFCYITLTIIFV